MVDGTELQSECHISPAPLPAEQLGTDIHCNLDQYTDT